jgi:hypothetical protein
MSVTWRYQIVAVLTAISMLFVCHMYSHAFNTQPDRVTLESTIFLGGGYGKLRNVSQTGSMKFPKVDSSSDMWPDNRFLYSCLSYMYQ